MANRTPKRQWYDVFVREYQILHQTDKALLIIMPKESKYAGWKFWFPRRLTAIEGYKSRRLRIPDRGMDIKLFAGPDVMEIPSRIFMMLHVTGEREE